MTEIRIDDADGNLLVGVDSDGLSASACLDAGADPDEIDAALAELGQELKHSARINGGRSA